MAISISTAVLIYGGIIDFKRREIPDVVPIALLLVGIFLKFSLLQSIIELVVQAVLLLAAAKITNSNIPGGDFKLLCSLGFACGLQELSAIIILAGIGAVVYGAIRRLPMRRNIPLCSYIAPAFITFQIIVLMVG